MLENIIAICILFAVIALVFLAMDLWRNRAIRRRLARNTKANADYITWEQEANDR